MSKPVSTVLEKLSNELERWTGVETDKVQGLRLRYLRKRTNVSRAELAKLLDVSIAYKFWESGSQKIPPKRFEQITKVFKKKHLEVSIQWLENGTGPEPYWNENHNIELEIKAFCDINENPVYIQITDDSMQPMYHKGDMVAGCWEDEHSPECLIGLPCIVELADGSLICRVVQKGTKKGEFSLISLNLLATCKNILMNNITFKRAARVKWTRRNFDDQE